MKLKSIAEKFCADMPKSRLVKPSAKFRILRAPLFIRKSTHTVKGKRDGIITLPERIMPSAAPLPHISGLVTINKARTDAAAAEIVRMIFFFFIQVTASSN